MRERRNQFSTEREQQVEGTKAEKVQLVSGRRARRYVLSTK